MQAVEGLGGEGGSIGLGDATPLAPGTATPGDSNLASRQNHVHPLPPKLATQRSIAITGAVVGSA